MPRGSGRCCPRDGGNVADVMDWLAMHNPHARDAIEEYVRHVVPSISRVMVKNLGGFRYLDFEQNSNTDGVCWSFPAGSVSDGTLRALGTLVALFQSASGAPGGVAGWYRRAGSCNYTRLRRARCAMVCGGFRIHAGRYHQPQPRSARRSTRTARVDSGGGIRTAERESVRWTPSGCLFCETGCTRLGSYCGSASCCLTSHAGSH